ncbi:MAG TPA: aquaporin [Actinomycetes bacterium]|nr:aquaporin [Actinomycetes bacterium]
MTADQTDLTRRLIAEFVGTFALVFLAVGTAVVGGAEGASSIGIALAFGLVLVFGVYAFGPVSGCHINPAVTIGMLLSRRIDPAVGGLYVVVQFLGGVLGGFMLWLMVEQFDVIDQTGVLGSNGYGASAGINLAGALVVETLLTLFFVLAVLLVTDRVGNAALAGVGIGAALAAVHLIGIGLTGTSVNPARSFGPALFAGGTPLEQVWVFILAPAAGGVLAALLYPVIRASVPPTTTTEAP